MLLHCSHHNQCPDHSPCTAPKPHLAVPPPSLKFSPFPSASISLASHEHIAHTVRLQQKHLPALSAA